MKKLILIILILVICFSTGFSQNINPIQKMCMPKQGQVILLVGAGSNWYDLNIINAQATSNINLLWNMHTNHKSVERKNKTMSKYVSYYTHFIFNPLVNNNIFKTDSFNVRNIAFPEDNMLINFNFTRTGLLKESKSSNFLFSNVVDISVTPYKFDSIAGFNNKFLTINGNYSMEFNYLSTGENSIVGTSLVLQFNYIYVLEEDLYENSFKRVMNFPTTSNISKNYAGFGGRLSVTLNTLTIYFDLRKYYPIDNNINISNLTKNPVYSIGVKTNGEIFRFII